jgi:hypothetical protein
MLLTDQLVTATKPTRQPAAWRAGAWTAERASASLQAQLAAYDYIVDVPASVQQLTALEEITWRGAVQAQVGVAPLGR